MARRLQLHEKLCEILGTRNVYFQPPSSVKLQYDCIVYKIKDISSINADDISYQKRVAYEVKFIHRDPDSVLVQTIIDSFTYCEHDNNFTTDNLHHDVYTIYY